jgi:hypothetical protein
MVIICANEHDANDDVAVIETRMGVNQRESPDVSVGKSTSELRLKS